MKRILCLVVAVMLLFSFVLVGCGTKTPTSSETQKPQVTKAAEATTAPAENANKPLVLKDSPYFQGKGLPPVANRMPKEPKITNEMPTDELKYQTGKYGGTLRTVRTDINWDADVFLVNEESLINSPGREGKEITPNIVKSYEVSTDQKEFTFVLRDGMKWSDGQPVTMEDVKFAVNDVLMNKELTPTFPAWLCAAGKAAGNPMTFEAIDNLTFKIKFDQPYGGFLIQLSVNGNGRGYADFIKPAHYLKKYHKTYANAAELEKAIVDAKFKSGEWVNLFNKMDIIYYEVNNPEAIGFPQLTPWILTKNGDVKILERNPYYFKMDSEGQQLPYIDQIQSTLVQNLEMVTMKILAGEVDHSYEWAVMSKIALYKENEAKGGFKTYINTKLHRTGTDIFLNMTYKDANWRKVVQDIRFRQALNLALNKQEIADTVYYGYAKLGQIQGTEFNLAAANKLLDEMGMTKGTDGFRKGPDGKKFTIPFEYAPHMTEFTAMAQLVAEQWKMLGLDVQLKQIDTALWGTRSAANELQCTLLWSSGLVMEWNFADWSNNLWGPLWNTWYTSNGKQGEKPPQDVLDFYKLADDLQQLSFADAKQKGPADIRANLKKNLWLFMPTQDIIQPVCVNAKIRNFADAGLAYGQNFAGEQWWFDK